MKTKSSRSSHPLVAFIILAIIAGLIMLNLWLYFWSQKELAPSKNQPVATTTDSLSDWQMYTNTDYGFSLQYPKDWHIWYEGAEEEMYLTIGDYPSESPHTNSFGLRIQIDTDLESYDMKRANPSLRCTDKQDVNISNYHAISYTCASSISSESFERYLLSNNGSTFDILVATSANKNAIVYKKILSTFRFTDDMSDWLTYTNDKYGFNIKYPSNWVAKEIPNQEYNGIVNFFQSGTKTYPELGGSQPIGENVVTLSLLKNPDDLTLQQIFNNDYNKCLQEPNNDFGCPRPQNTEPWQTITVDGAKAWRTGDISIPEGPGADTLYIKQDGYYIKLTLMFFQPDRKNIDTAILDQMISTFRFNNSKIIPETYTNTTLGFSIQHPTGWKIDDTSTPNKVWFNPAQTEVVDSIEVTTGTLATWSGDATNIQSLVIDGYPAKQVNEEAFSLQSTAIEKNGKLYVITSNRDIKRLGLLSTFKFIK